MITSGRRVQAAIALGVAGVAGGAAVIVLAAGSTHLQASDASAALNAIVVWSFAVAGAFAWLRRPGNRIGLLMVWAGVVWFLSSLQGSDVSALYTIGLLTSSLPIGAITHLILAFPAGRLWTWPSRLLTVIAYVAPVGVQVAAALVLDPTLGGACASCPTNDALVARHDDLAQALFDASNSVSLAVALAVLAILVGRLRTASAPARRATAPVLWAGAATAAVAAVSFAADVSGGDVIVPARLATFAAVSLVPLGFLALLLRARLAQSAVSRLVVELSAAPAPGRLREAIARSLGDPSLQVAYWLPAIGSYVDAHGRPLELPAERSGRAVTVVEREGERIAALVHDVSLLEQPELVDAVGAAAGLALRNERLQAELHARLEDLRISEGRLRALIDASPLAIVEVDLEGRVTFWNRAAERLYGWTSEEAIGELISFVPEQHAGETDELRRRLLSGETITEVETMRLRKDGSLVEVALSAGPVSDASGQIVRYMAVSVDVSERKRAERELRGSEDRMRALIDASPAAIVELDLESNVMLWNPAAERMFGWTAEEVIGRQVQTVPDEFREQAQSLRERVLADERLPPMAVKRQRKDGRSVDVEISAAPVRDDAGRVVRLMGLFIDITERLSAQEELRHERDFISALIDSAAALVVVLDREGRFVRFNRACERLTGYSFEEVRGRPFYELFIEPSETEPIRRALAKVWAGDFPADNENHWILRDGTRRLIAWSNTALLDGSGNVEYIIASGLDITDRKRIEEEVRASRARIVEAADQARRKLERNLHDGAQQRLVALSLALRMAQAQVKSNPEAADQLLTAASDELAQALEELRELARGIHPAVLIDRGLPAALEALARRSPVPVSVDVELERRLPPQVEAAAYYVVSEALANVAKYAAASSVTVSVAGENGGVLVQVADDGVGGADPAQGSGLRGLADRVAALDGKLVVSSEPGHGTQVRAEIPCSAAWFS